MNEEIKIESGIPVPTRRLGRKAKYPIGALEVGESFEVTAATREQAGSRLNGAVSQFRRVNASSEKRFQVSRTEKGARVWRIA